MRPFESRSSVANAFAIVSGGWYAAMNTFVIKRVRVVCAARYPSVAIGSNHCVDIISAGSCGIATWWHTAT